MKVIPRDLFNDANLLSNYGRLYIDLEKYNLQKLLHSEVEEHQPFQIITDDSNGFTHIANIKLYSIDGNEIKLFRGLNSRETFSLWFVGQDDDYPVFTEYGELTNKLLQTIGIVDTND